MLNNSESLRLDENDVNDAFTDIESFCRGGMAIEKAIQRISRMYSEPVLNAAEAAYRRKLSSSDFSGDFDPYIKIVEKSAENDLWYTGPNEKIDTYWPPVRRSIQAKLGDAVTSIDEASTSVIRSLRRSSDPEFNLKGLVVGYVQSGKTTNFMSVIAKAADVGYRLIIVLTGMTENLRQQTQQRLEEQLIFDETGNWHRLTTVDQDFTGDKNPQGLKNSDTRFIAVVKKNAPRLKALNKWINRAGKLSDSCPILVIDDEADQASIDVGTGKRRSAINQQISDLLDHQKTAYIAYTATPFANVLINPNKIDDLYPANFIQVLPEPDGYFGTEALFGREPLHGEEYDIDANDGVDVIRTISETEVQGIKPPSRSSTADWYPDLGPALRDAIAWFFLATAARWCRGDTDKHSSMLIHTSMLTDRHEELKHLVNQEHRRLKKIIQDSGVPLEWRKLWERETEAVPASDFGLEKVPFVEVIKFVPQVIQVTRVIIDNAQSSDRLNYENPRETIIAIGGNTLSRGLTLEGLISSYFVRQASAFDTLLQMGRWFGFRKGYEDLPRVWMPAELIDWFRDLALVEADLRRELAVYAAEKVSPMEIQARIRKHPAMLVTARAKMRDSIEVSASFSGQRVQTIKFKANDSNWLRHNIIAARQFAEALENGGAKRKQQLSNGSTVFYNVDTEEVLSFLRNYQFHEETRLGNGDLMIRYIESERSARTLKLWNVSFFSLAKAPSKTPFAFTDSLTVHRIQRSKLRDDASSDANIKSLVGSIDRLNDLPLSDKERQEVIQEVLKKINTSKLNRDAVIRDAHESYAGTATGHLAIYVIDKDSKAKKRKGNKEEQKSKLASYTERVDLEACEDIIGVGIFYPKSANQNAGVEYIKAMDPDEDSKALYNEIDEQIGLAEEADSKLLEKENSAP